MKNSFLAFFAASSLIAGCSPPPQPPVSTPAPPPVTVVATPATPAAGQEVVMEQVGLKYVVPAGWNKESPELITSPDKKLAIFFVTPPEGDAKAILAQIATNLDTKLKDVKITGQATEHEINGIDSWFMEGTGTTPEGQKMEFALELMVAQKPVILLEMAEEGAFETNKAAFDAFEESLEKIGGDAAAAPGTPMAGETPADGASAVASETPADSGTPMESESPASAETPEASESP